MKTAISIPDAIFEAAEQLAESRGLSRSELYTKAIAEYLSDTRYRGVRERLDALYGSEPATSQLDPALAGLQSASIGRDDW